MKTFNRSVATIAATATLVAVPLVAAPSATAATQGLDKRCMTGRALCINKSTHKMYWVVNGKVKGTWAVRTGRKGMETHNGVHHIYLKRKNHMSSLYHVNMPYTQFFSGGQAVHYSHEFANRGYMKGSHGCANMNTMAGAKALYSQTRVGDKVVVYN